MANPPAAMPANKDVSPVCGIIMPIAAMPPKYEASHWSDVRKIFDAAITKAGMTPQIVSDSFESDVIQQRIISNLYDNPVVICDVSGLNPNVMFELGMRITFKQPVIIVTDDFASIPFDTKVIEHLGYPRDLHIHLTNEFIEKLSARIVHLHGQKKDGSFRSFIEAFGTFDVLEPTKKVVEADQLILDRLEFLGRTISRLVDSDNRYKHNALYARSSPSGIMRIDFGRNSSEKSLTQVTHLLKNMLPTCSVEVTTGPKGEATISVDLSIISESDRFEIENKVRNYLPVDLGSRINIRWT